MPKVIFKWIARALGDCLICTVCRSVDLKPYGIESCVPKGFLSDGMSVPRFFWRFLGPKVAPDTACPSIVHDWLYTCHTVSRKAADAWYRDALISAGYGRLKSWLVYIALRCFGASHWEDF